MPRPTVLALDLEGTLISNAVSRIPRPGLFVFLERCCLLFPRIVAFTAVREARFRAIAAELATEGLVPPWFAELECVAWDGATKDLRFVTGARVDEILLVDDMAAYVHAGQERQWVKVVPFEPPYTETDRGLDDVLREVTRRVVDEGAPVEAARSAKR